MQNDTKSEKVAPISPQPDDPTPDSPNRLRPKTSRNKWIVVAILAPIIIAAGLALWLSSNHKTKPTVSQTTRARVSAPSPQVQGIQLDPSKNYGNKYANGLLPVGDGKYVTDAPKQGYIYACSGYAHNIQTESGGAGRRGPWFVNNNTQYDINKKLHVQGSKTWQPQFSDTVTGATRTITTNDLPNHPTGNFPVSPTDPSYAYDRNPNLITEQNLTYTLDANPVYGTPQCMGGQAGTMLTGAALFNGFDAAGRDAGAWEIQDNCDGHPQSEGEYHYHTLSSCIKDVNVKTVIGFALDGFPITGPQVGINNILTTSDLDECHGLTSQVVLDGKTITTYHYVMTQDFPYSVSCFRAQPIQPPGQKPPPH